MLQTELQEVDEWRLRGTIRKMDELLLNSECLIWKKNLINVSYRQVKKISKGLL